MITASTDTETQVKASEFAKEKKKKKKKNPNQVAKRTDSCLVETVLIKRGKSLERMCTPKNVRHRTGYVNRTLLLIHQKRGSTDGTKRSERTCTKNTLSGTVFYSMRDQGLAEWLSLSQKYYNIQVGTHHRHMKHLLLLQVTELPLERQRQGNSCPPLAVPS